MTPYTPNPPSKIKYTFIMAADLYTYRVTAAQDAVKNVQRKESVVFRFMC